MATGRNSSQDESHDLNVFVRKDESRPSILGTLFPLFALMYRTVRDDERRDPPLDCFERESDNNSSLRLEERLTERARWIRHGMATPM